MYIIFILTIYSMWLATTYVLAFLFGFKLGRKNSIEEIKEKPKKRNTDNPIQKYKEHITKKESEKEARKLEVIMQNIDNYDGTPNGQIDIPD